MYLNLSPLACPTRVPSKSRRVSFYSEAVRAASPAQRSAVQPACRGLHQTTPPTHRHAAKPTQPRPTKPPRRSNPNARPQLISGPFSLSRADIPQKQQQRALGRKYGPTRAGARKEGKRVCACSACCLHDSIDFAATPGRVWWGEQGDVCRRGESEGARGGAGWLASEAWSAGWMS
jgi:hypothetical protein